jgi:hypothetical protein
MTAALLLLAGAAEAGRWAGEFLSLGAGARGLALGQAMVAADGDPFSFHWNPAALALVDRRAVAGMAASNFGSLGDPMASHAQLGLVLPIGQGNLAFNYLRHQVDDIPRFPEYADNEYTFEQRRRLIEERGGAPFGVFRNVDQAFYLSFAKYSEPVIELGWLYRDLPIQLPVGLNFKLIHSALDDQTGLGLGFDAGVQARIAVADIGGPKGLGELALGARFDNFTNTGLKWDGGEDAINYFHVLGLAWSAGLGHLGWTLSLDLDHHYDTQRRVGLELNYIKRLWLRAGHQGREGRLTYGAGFRLGALGLDYAGLDHDLGRVHRMSFTYAF